jgi:hypothetical protein
MIAKSGRVVLWNIGGSSLVFECEPLFGGCLSRKGDRVLLTTRSGFVELWDCGGYCLDRVFASPSAKI